MARTRRVIPVSEKIDAKKTEIAKLEAKLSKAREELKVLEDKATAEKKKGLVDMILKSGKSDEEIKEFFGVAEKDK